MVFYADDEKIAEKGTSEVGDVASGIRTGYAYEIKPDCDKSALPVLSERCISGVAADKNRLQIQ